MIRLRRGMVSEDGAGWAVTGYEGEALPGRWATKAEAEAEGLCGVYLLSGVDVVYVECPDEADDLEARTDRASMDAEVEWARRQEGWV